MIPENYKITNHGEKFLLYDSELCGQRILVFGTKEGLQLLNTSPKWYMDGCFKTKKSMFAQIFTIHVMVNDYSIPAIYAFLPDKSASTYVLLFNQVKILAEINYPIEILSDFEMGIISAIRSVFPQSKFIGIYYLFNF